jgi:hypothetical protein
VAVAGLAGLGIALFLALLVLPIASLVLRIPLPALLAGAPMTWARALGELLVTMGAGLAVALMAVVGLQATSRVTRYVLQGRLVMAQVAAANLDAHLGAALSRLEAIAAP